MCRNVSVNSTTSIKAALSDAMPCDVITISPGTYSFDDTKINALANGTSGNPITLRAQNLDTVTVKFI